MDEAGHTHRWYLGDRPACDTIYRARESYHVPSLVEVADDPWVDEDGEEISRSHLECKQCRETVEPGYCEDNTTQYIEGLVRWKEYTIRLDHRHTASDLLPYSEHFSSGLPMLVLHPLGFSINVFVQTIAPFGGIGGFQYIDITLVPTGPPLT